MRPHPVPPFAKPRRALKVLALCMAAASSAMLSGCGSGSKTSAGTLSIVAANGAASGQLTSLAVNGAARLTMTPLNDPLSAGVDWSVVCGGSPETGSITGGACGTLSPAHTPSGAATVYTAPAHVPIGNTVTITASVTSDPSATSSVTLTITPAAIVLDFSATPVTSLIVGGTAEFTVLLVNDATGAGAAWSASCGATATAGACGTFNPATTTSGAQTTYTAPSAVPSGGTVTITATSIADPTRSVSASIAIIPAQSPISVALSSTTLTIGERASASLIGTVANDASNAGLTWTVTCAASMTTGNCGSISPSTTASGDVVTYKAPSTASGVNPVTITATAVATSGSTAPVSATAAATVTASSTITVTLSASTSNLVPLGTTVLNASVKNDASNAGVTFSVSCGGTAAGACGIISNAAGSGADYTATYTAPATIPPGGLVTVSAAPNAALNAPAGTTVPDNPGLATLTIAPVPPTIAFVQLPPAGLTTNGQAVVSAAVTNDVAPGGVTWTVQCGDPDAGACGYVQPYQTASGASATYVAPPIPPSGATGTLAAGQVVIVATSTADASVSALSVPLTITASTSVSIRFVPSAPSQVTVGTSVNVQAAVGNDPTNAGVDWQVCANVCGYFTVTPAQPAIAATATTPFVPAVPAVTNTTVTGWPNALPILYTAPLAAPSGGAVTIIATAAADGSTSASASVIVSSQTTGPMLQGKVMAGSQPVAGSAVSLYVAGMSGYGSAATLIYSAQSGPTATTDQNGNFTFDGGYPCPQATSQTYLVATGGQVGSFADNANLSLMTALGPCTGLSSTPVVLNEVTTVASAWSLSRFGANDSLTGNSSYLYLGSSSGNTVGLANAFASVDSLVDITTGQALFFNPAGNAAVPYPEINTLANILNTCTASSGGVEGDGSACGTLFAATDPLGYNGLYNSTPPGDTIQAAFNIAQHPDTQGFLNYDLPGVSTIPLETFVALSTPASPFQPILTVVPNDFSLSLNYTGGGGLTPSSNTNSLALDGSGNLWFSDASGNSAIEWNNAGTPVSPATGYMTASLSSPGPLAIDSAGNVWVCDSNGLTELNGLGNEVQGSPFVGGGLSGACQGLAFDGLGNLWANNSKSVSKFTSLGVPLSPSTGYTIAVSPADPTVVGLLPPIAIDDSNNVWVAVVGPGSEQVQLDLAELNNASGLPNYLNGPPSGTDPLSNYVIVEADAAQTEIAIDSAGDVWVPSAGGNGSPLTKVLPYAGPGTTDKTSQGFVPGGGADPFLDARGVAIDGAGLVWIASTGSKGGAEGSLPGGLVEIRASDSTNFAYYVSPSLSNRALVVVVDSSGNVWALLENNTVTEYVGLATPAVTPLASAVKSQKLGAQP